jgi:hypothetical protein
MGYKMVELISKVDLDPKSSSTSSILRAVGKAKTKVKIKLKSKEK